MSKIPAYCRTGKRRSSMVDAQTQPVKVTGCHPRHLQPYEPPPQYGLKCGVRGDPAPGPRRAWPRGRWDLRRSVQSPTSPRAPPRCTRDSTRTRPHAAHNTIPRIKTFRRYPHLQATKPDGSPIRQRVDETTHAPRNVRYLLPTPAIGGRSRVLGTTHQVAVLVEEVVIAVRQNGVS